MKRLITIDISPATDTHCGDYESDCKFLRSMSGLECMLFGLDVERDPDRETGRRLPECIAAEKSEPDHGLF